MKPESVTAAIGAVGAVIFIFIANIPPSEAADGIQMRGTIVGMDGSTLTVKTREGAIAQPVTRGI